MASSSPAQYVNGSQIMGSEVTFDILCFTCNSKGKIHEAEGYCLDCCEHLCTKCLKYHTECSATKHHRLIDKKNMPMKQSILSAFDICTERCHNHKDEIIKYFCPAHKLFGCSVCVTLKHQQCLKVTYIPDAAAELRDSQEFNDFQNKLEKLIEKTEYITKVTQSNIKLSADYQTKAMQDIETYRQELNDALDKLKQELENQSEQIEVNDSEKMNTVAYASNQVHAEVQRISSDIKSLLDKNQHCKLFIDMKTAEAKLTAIQDRLPKEEDTFITVVRFQPNLELRTLVQNKYALGQLLFNSPSEMNASILKEINVNGRRKVLDFISESCNVKSVALLSEDKLVILDEAEKSVKLLDTNKKRIVNEYKMYTSPYDVTIVGQTQFAVTLPHAKKIQFLDSEDELHLYGEITFDKKCWYVECVDDKLVVSCSEPYKVILINMYGELLHTFATSNQGDNLFNSMPRLSVSSFNQAIYASDWKANRVTMLDMDGNVNAVYEDTELDRPCHTAVDDTGMVYICGSGSHNIHLLTPDCRKVKVLLSKRNGIMWPQGICFCKKTRILYVTMEFRNHIKVIQLS